MKRAKRALLWIGLAVVLLLVGTVVAGWAVLRASLPRTGGHTVVPGMTAPVEVSRDALGIPTIEGASTLDVARGQGFVHAQDRYFQMDLTRRFAAGELTPLFGDIADNRREDRPAGAKSNRNGDLNGNFRSVRAQSLCGEYPGKRPRRWSADVP